ncbi:mandelate racemase/muconate lactonizing enzyme family protein [Falsiroseomonas selenitidurans]|uniref:Mandelate racemase/muconate lactonizing enzyme family protein n=1 Tax=Falsiroseomonas selenitidurans TaxID=2716335 RepID=A0ABX1E1L9_9PROT|nr:mandelate racemase/muconate lactonizing enzyme family protein [Falsiroseomonas selenitidurans]NKC30585.1 mandelate racemase/muconate lactonizing enzyme family protein [Falsiroseomonas selenitidurans]
MTERIARVEAFRVVVPREVPYLGPLRAGEAVNERGYFIRAGNRSVYPTTDTSVLVKLTTESGAVGWGECYAIVAPGAVAEIITDLLGPLAMGRDPRDPVPLHEDLYDTMRVRGFFGGYFVDALAGLDIAVWDVAARLAGLPLARLLGGRRHGTLPAYLSGLPKPSLAERVAFAEDWAGRGFTAVKFAAAVAERGEVAEMAALRRALGPDIRIACDMHWKHTALAATRLIDRMHAHDLWFAEAPVQAEDLEGQREVAAKARTSIALGEEWRTAFEYRPRLVARCMDIVQPEMAHTGVTEFMKIGRMAEAFHCRVIPHASIGIGIFQAASLQASVALQHCDGHEYQHSIFDRNLRFLDGDMACEAGEYRLPEGPGLGVVPNAAVWQHATSH